jgi:tetratricopeptide (TPR) repeat protein
MSLFTLTLALLLVAGFVWVSGWAIWRFAPEDGQRGALVAEWPWLAKGLVLPFALWVVMNLGLSDQLQPFMPSIQAAQIAGKPWFRVFLRVASGGLLVIVSCWCAITLIWQLLRAHQSLSAEDRFEFRATCFGTLLLTSVPAAALLFLGGWALSGIALVVIGAPMISYSAPILHRPRRRPMYSRAVARMKMGNYSDAEQEILQQLEKSENDFDGWMLLAELHATRFKELAEAEKIILDVCVHPETTPGQISVALQKLADWQITLAADPEAAARTLQLLCDRLPGTHLAAMAAARKAQLPTNQEYEEKRNPKPIHVPQLPSIMNPESALHAEKLKTREAVEQVNELTEKLTKNPDSISDRERLARLLADSLGKADLAIEQLELLLGLHNQPGVKRVEWLTLIAGWQLQLLQEEAAASATLTRIIAEFPNTPHAFTAQRRLSLMKAEAAARKS